ncbi:hypothetical protein D1007_46419 [Hordeum vulgare]|nr:hypothetical protein D1007_46419 [Hordeum vulgare]
MAEAHGDIGAAARDVVELQGTVIADEVKDVGGIHDGAGKLATATDVEKEVVVSASVLTEQKVTASSGAVHSDTHDAQPGKEQGVFVELVALEDDGWGKMMDGGKEEAGIYWVRTVRSRYDSGEDVYKTNFKSFKAKEVEKIKAKGVASFFNRKIKK